MYALLVTTLPMPDSGASTSGSDDTQMLPNQQPLKGYKCVERDAGTSPAPAQTSVEEQGGAYC